MNQPTMVIAGANGFLGQVLCEYFVSRKWKVIALTRNLQADAPGIHYVQWDGSNMGPWAQSLEGARALINLAGRSVNCRYHAANRKRILSSRVVSTRLLGEAISHCKHPPQVWLNASTATIYRHSYDKPHAEDGEIAGTPEAKDEFSVEVARQWEQALRAATTPQTRKVALRTGMVLGTKTGSVFRVLRNLVHGGLGGRMGSGRQYISWLHEIDFCRAMEWIIEHETLADAVNVTSPHPVTNERLMSVLRELCGRRIGLPASQWMLEVGAFFLRTETELIIKSRRVVPTKLLASGFRFNFPEIREALAELNQRVAGL